MPLHHFQTRIFSQVITKLKLITCILYVARFKLIKILFDSTNHAGSEICSNYDPKPGSSSGLFTSGRSYWVPSVMRLLAGQRHRLKFLSTPRFSFSSASLIEELFYSHLDRLNSRLQLLRLLVIIVWVMKTKMSRKHYLWFQKVGSM